MTTTFDATQYTATTRVQWLHQMLSGLDDAGREAAWTDIDQQLGAFEGSTGFVGPCELVLVAVGVN
jgi:hypothetical protein